MLFLQGGATLQFAQVPMNLLRGKGKADYVVTGEWSKKAVKEAKNYCDVAIAASSEDRNFTYAPKKWKVGKMRRTCTARTRPSAASSTTPFRVKEMPLVADASSHFLSRPIDVSKFGLIYAGAQKNAGPAGLDRDRARRPDRPGGEGHAERHGLQAAGRRRLDAQHAGDYSLYIAGLVFKWLKQQGGLASMEKKNIEKAKAALRLPRFEQFFRNPVAKEDRSRMNVPFTLKDKALDDAFLKGAAERGLVSSRATARWAACARRSTTRCRSKACSALSSTCASSNRRMAKARAKKCEILVINQIAQVGLKRFPARYAVVKESKDPQAILVRSQDLHKFEFGPSLRAVGRAGAGTNNIPVAALSKRGVPVFNAPGANANAVKELVLAGMLIAARNLAPALEFVEKPSPG